VLTQTGFQIRQLDRPTFGPDEVLVRTSACGVCSGDLFVYQNRFELAETHSRLGHEASGVVAEVGQRVTAFAEGDVVTALSEPAYSDFFVATPDQLCMLPPEIDPAFALGEPVACCVHAGNRFGTLPGHRVAVVGCGFMGLLCLQIAKHQEAGFLCALDPDASRLEMSKAFGADVALSPSETGAQGILAQTGEFDLVIEAAGTQSALDLCGDLVTEHGCIVLVGYHQSKGGMRTVNMQQWNYKAIDVVNGHVRRPVEKAQAMCQGMGLMREGHIVTEPLVTTYDLRDIEQAFRDLTSRKPGLVKAVLLMA
jgi:threonine dehydrogenase-like Zn-dependent dehydrogenase